MFMHRIKLENILSFGPDAQELELKPLNVLIGPNGSGKSNVIEVIGLLRALPNDLSVQIGEVGGDDYWMWHGEKNASEARLEAVVEPTIWRSGRRPLRYLLAFDTFFIPTVNKEIVEDENPGKGKDATERYLERGRDKIWSSYQDDSGGRSRRDLSLRDFQSYQSILAQLKDPSQYPELTILGRELGRIQIYQEWSFGRNTPPRLAQKADLPNQFLSEDGKNLGMVLNRLEGNSKAKNQLLTALRQLYHGIDDYHVQVEAGSVQVFLKEGNVPIPATRLSDGTLRYLCLLAILCNPRLPPLVCIEEPELGLHPDILPGLANLLREASERCQIIVTTHSDTLVDALTDTPESIVVCEKENGQTKLKRLDKGELSHWLEKYRLGELWTSGELGGNRW